MKYPLAAAWAGCLERAIAKHASRPEGDDDRDSEGDVKPDAVPKVGKLS